MSDLSCCARDSIQQSKYCIVRECARDGAGALENFALHARSTKSSQVCQFALTKHCQSWLNSRIESRQRSPRHDRDSQTDLDDASRPASHSASRSEPTDGQQDALHGGAIYMAAAKKTAKKSTKKASTKKAAKKSKR
jgi:hypothetical protein